MTALGTTTVRLLHRVTATHALTGAPVTPLAARLLPPVPPWWTVVVKGGDVLVIARTGLPPVAGTPRLSLRVTHPGTAALLAQPTVDIPLTGPELAHAFAPVPQTVTVVLTDGTGAPRTGRDVGAVPPAGAAVPLPELGGTPGTYRSAALTWTAATSPFDLTVDGVPQRRLGLDPTRIDTRVHVVSTT